MCSCFGSVRDPVSVTPEAPVVTVLMYVLKVSSHTYPEHVRQVNMLFDRAEERTAQFGVRKCVFAAEKCELWGFEIDSEGRRPTPAKLDQLENWPDYICIEDIRSHVHFAEYLKELVPDLPEIILPLRKYLKKGASFDDYQNDESAKLAKRRLTEVLAGQATPGQPGLQRSAAAFRE